METDELDAYIAAMEEHGNEQFAELDLHNTAVESFTFADFYRICKDKGCIGLYLGYSYYSFKDGGEPALIFQMGENSSFSVFNFLNQTLDDIFTHLDNYSVEKRKSGYYVLCGITEKQESSVLPSGSFDWDAWEKDISDKKKSQQKNDSSSEDELPF